ncbi:ParB/RepB/Spo0J family partition protein [Propionivibrio sp.]|uniref:ParB/RepB/Spo0J family partition protein n=1 Tax=Propionivibrio sp. TaxID=2212460 RepID=UPI003BF33BB9
MKAKLAAKLQSNQARHAKAPHETDLELGREHKMLQVDRIDPNPFQPRTIFPEDELVQLAQSIDETGLIQPITVRIVGDRYQLIAGERRWRAHKYLGKRTIEAIVQEASDDDLAVAALAENMDREDLSDYEIGKAIRQVESLFPSRVKLAEGLGLNREDMYKYFAFDALPTFIIESLDKNPRLISRIAATDVKALLNRTNASPAALDALRAAIELVTKKELDQSKIVDYVTRVLRGEPMRKSSEAAPLTKDGLQVGSVTHDSRNVIVKIRTAVLGEKKEQALRDFIEKLIQQ